MKQQSARPDFFSRYDGEKSLPFTSAEYERRLTTLRHIMDEQNVSATVLTSMHNVAYYSGFLYCSFENALESKQIISLSQLALHLNTLSEVVI